MAKRRDVLRSRILKAMHIGVWMSHHEVQMALKHGGYKHVPSPKVIAQNLGRIDDVEVRTALDQGRIVRYYKRKR